MRYQREKFKQCGYALTLFVYLIHKAPQIFGFVWEIKETYVQTTSQDFAIFRLYLPPSEKDSCIKIQENVQILKLKYLGFFFTK